MQVARRRIVHHTAYFFIYMQMQCNLKWFIALKMSTKSQYRDSEVGMFFTSMQQLNSLYRIVSYVTVVCSTLLVTAHTLPACRCRRLECSSCKLVRGRTSSRWRPTDAVVTVHQSMTVLDVRVLVGRSSVSVSATTRQRFQTDPTVRTAASSPRLISSLIRSNTATSTFRSSSPGR